MTLSNLKVGITGGIGSGKTTVCRIFETLGIPVYYADDRAKWLMNNDPTLKEAIRALFGPSAYTAAGELNRPYLAKAAFGNADLLQQLNALVHPAVWRDGEQWQEAHHDAPYTLKEAALLYESGGHQLLDRMIVVYAPTELRIRRVMRRDGVDRADVEARIARQLPDEEKVRRADFVIYNDGEQLLVPQVWAIHRQLLELVNE